MEEIMDYKKLLNDFKIRIDRLERESRDEKNIRFAMVRYIASYLVSADLDGDYCEFGVGEGKVFSYAIRAMARKWPHMCFWGYDTFTGMPKPSENDKYAGFTEGQFAFPKREVEQFCFKQNYGISPERIRLVEGNFSHTLKEAGPHPRKVAVAFIDAIYKESIAMVLDFLTGKIDVGSLLIFDDWHGMRNLPDMGSQGACNEWIKKTGVRLAPCFPFGGLGQSFTVLSVGGKP